MQMSISLRSSIIFYVLFALGYFFLGQFLSTVSFQSQIMPVWLPAGIGLVGTYLWGWRFLPAVFLASFSFNFTIHPLDEFSALFSEHGAELVSIAFGASLQAFIGSYFLSKFGNPVSQSSSLNVFKFIVVVGLVVNLISSNIGIWSLSTFNSAYNEQNYWVDVLYWWLGDSLGVLLMAPFLLSLLDLRAENSEHKKPRWIVISATFLLSATILTLTTFFINLSNEAMEKLTSKEVKNIENSFYRELNNSMAQLHNLASYLQNTPDLNREKFSQFVASLMADYSSIHAMSWNPVIYQKDKRQHEQELERIYQAPISIQGMPIEQEDPIVYVKFISPEADNMKALGFNVFSNPQRKQTLVSTEASFQPKATPIINLVQTTSDVPAYLMFFPVFKKDFESSRQLKGYATGIFLVEKMLRNALSLSEQNIFNYELYESGSNQSFSSNTGTNDLVLGKNANVKQLRFVLAGQTWRLNLVPDEAYLIKEQTRSYLLLFTLEVVIVTFIMLFILVMNSREVELNKLVQKRTTSLNLALDEAKTANKAKSRFLANMSHEIRTPLNAVVGFSQLANNSTDIVQMKSYIEKIKLSAEMLINIVNDILDFSKIESGKLEVSNVSLDLHLILKRVNSLFEGASAEKSISWQVKDEIPLNLNFTGDPVRIEQVLINLCSNALKFTQEGSVVVLAKLNSQDETSAHISISIKDTGIGIDKNTQTKLFNVFTQADDSTTRNFGGSGLGLAISKELSHLMGGDITVHSELGKGSEFVFEFHLPVVGSAGEKISSAADVPEEVTLKKLSELKVLVAEDNRINQLLIQNILSQVGIEPIIAENGKQALLAAQLKQFDVILMDCQMPVLDGYEATKQLRAMPQFALLPVIALTADADIESRERALEIGFSDFLTKPIDIDLLLDTLKKFL